MSESNWVADGDGEKPVSAMNLTRVFAGDAAAAPAADEGKKKKAGAKEEGVVEFDNMPADVVRGSGERRAQGRVHIFAQGKAA